MELLLCRSLRLVADSCRPILAVHVGYNLSASTVSTWHRLFTENPRNETSRGTITRLIAARIVLALRTFRYQFTSYIARVSGKRLREFFENETFSGLLIGWVLVFPALFIFLLVITVLLLPFSFLLHPCPSILRTKHEE